MPTIINGTTGVDQIQDGSVTAADLASASVTPSKTSGFVVTQANQTPLPGLGALLSFSHGLGVVPVSAELELVCLTAEGGYSVGDVINPQTSGSPSYAHNFTICKNATVVEARVGNNSPWYVVHKTTGAIGGATPANWAWRFKVRAV